MQEAKVYRSFNNFVKDEPCKVRKSDKKNKMCWWRTRLGLALVVVLVYFSFFLSFFSKKILLSVRIMLASHNGPKLIYNFDDLLQHDVVVSMKNNHNHSLANLPTTKTKNITPMKMHGFNIPL